ncbi:MAG: YjfB family protein [Treponemataceae bacterium]
MDIAQLSMDTAQNSLMDKVGVSMLSKSLDKAKTDADALALLMSTPLQAPLEADSGTVVDIMA